MKWDAENLKEKKELSENTFHWTRSIKESSLGSVSLVSWPWSRWFHGL